MGRKKKKQTTESSKKSHTKKTHPEDRNGFRLKVLKPEILIIGVFILALSIRLLYLNQIISTPIFHGLAVDAEKYDSFALYILKGNLTHKDFIYLNPLYPFFLAFIYLIFGHSHLSVVLIQAIIDSISCVLIYYIASVLFNKRVGIIASFIYACYGIAVFYTGILLAPTVVVFFTLLFIASLLVAQEKSRVLTLFISGIIFGLAVLARPNVILFLFLLPLWFFTVLKNRLGIYKSIQGFLFLLVGFFMVTSLISIRNYSIEKKFSPSVLGGINFYIGNNPEATGYFMPPHGVSSSPIEEIKTSVHRAGIESGQKLSPSQASRYWLFKGLKFIKNNPQDAFSLYMKKFALFWRKEEIPVNINYHLSKTFAPIFQLPFISFGIIAPFAILGIILSRRRKDNLLLVTLFVFCYMASVIIFFVSARYRLPIVPFFVIYSSYALYRLGEMIRAKEVKDITILGVVLIPLFVGMNKNFECFKLVHQSFYNNLGRIYNMEGRVDEAIVEIKKSLSIDSHFAEAHCNLGYAYHRKGLIREAIDEYKKAIKINPDYAEAHTNLGNAYDNEGRLDEAISEHKKALAINPNFAEAHYNLGASYHKKGELDKAISQYKQAAAIKSNYADACYNLGVAYHKKGKLDKAISQYKQAVAIKSDFAKARNNLAIAYHSKGNYKLAIFHCDKAIALGGSVNPKLLELLKPYR